MKKKIENIEVDTRGQSVYIKLPNGQTVYIDWSLSDREDTFIDVYTEGQDE